MTTKNKESTPRQLYKLLDYFLKREAENLKRSGIPSNNPIEFADRSINPGKALAYGNAAEKVKELL